jgi:hypothetical protein
MFVEQILTELFNDPVQVTPAIPEKYNYFKVDGVQFTVAFEPLGGTKNVEVFLHRDDGQDDPFSSRGDFGQSGLLVYSTFVSVIKKYLKLYQPPALTITGADSHQQQLYTRMARYMLVPGYKLFIDPKDPARTAQIIHEDIAPNQDELKRIEADKKIKRRPKVRDMLFTDMPGNDATYPAF